MAINGSDTSFLILCTVLVMLMTPGLALFYGGMVRRKNVLNITMQIYAAIVVISIQWILIGYTLCFGNDIGGIIGDLRFLNLRGVGYAPNASYATTIPHEVFMLFQLMFAIITPAIISGAVAERMKLSAFIVFMALWSTIVYDPIVHWVWGSGGWLRQLGVLDFAGGNAIEIASGLSGLAAAMVIGKRKRKENTKAHHIPMTLLGLGILWFGWFGFNAGSAYALNSTAINAIIVTNTSGAAGAISWSLCEKFFKRKVSALGFAGGAIGGLVAITPAAGYVSPMSALLIGAVSGFVCFYAIAKIKEKFGYDDALDVFGCHGIGGIWGTIATGIFASKAINSSGKNGLIYGNINVLAVQLLSVCVVAIYSFVGTFAILKTIDAIWGIRVSEEEEHRGLDFSIHGEDAYGEPHTHIYEGNIS